MVADVIIDEKDDRWCWNHGSNVEFSVRDVRKWLKGADVLDDDSRFTWSKWIPNKCNIFMWRANMDRIPTMSALRRRNIVVGEEGCYLCGEEDESTDHIFTACRIANGVWVGVDSWCRLSPLFFFSIRDVQVYIDHMRSSKTKKDIVYGVLILTVWRIWKARNDKAFANIETTVAHIVADIKGLGYLWYRSRCKGCKIDWKGWCNFLIDMM